MNIQIKNRFHFLLYVFFGITSGIILLIAFGATNRWTWFIYAGLVVPWLMLLTPDPKLALLFLLILLVPINTDLILNYRLHPGGAKGWTFSLIDIPLLILYLLWFVEKFNKRKKTLWFPKITIPLTGFVIIGIISLFKASHGDLVLYQLFVLIKKIFFIIYIGNNLKDEKSLKYVIVALFIGFLFECMVGFLQYQTKGKLGLYLLGERENDIDKFYLNNFEQISRVSGTFWHSNGFGYYLQMVIPVGIGIFLVGAKGIYRIIIGFLIILGLIALILTLSRGAWISFIFSIIFLIYLYVRRFSSNQKIIKRLLPSIVILIIILGIFGNFIYSRLISEDYGAAQSRIFMMKTAFNIIKQNPILGIGMNNYVERMAEFDKIGFSRSFYYPVHNQFLLIASETGIFSLLLFLLAIFAAMLKGFKAFKLSDGIFAGTSLGVLSGLIGFIGHAQIDLALIDMLHIFWFYLGLSCAFYQVSKKHLNFCSYIKSDYNSN